MSRPASPPGAPTPRGLPDPGRRRLLETGTGLILLATVGGCPEAPPPGPAALRIPLAELAPGERRVVQLGTRPIEVQRTPEGVIARSLLCRHRGCKVAWVAAEGRYHCACHGGQYDAAGSPVAGPPQRPLKEVPTTLEGEVIVIGGEA